MIASALPRSVRGLCSPVLPGQACRVLQAISVVSFFGAVICFTDNGCRRLIFKIGVCYNNVILAALVLQINVQSRYRDWLMALCRWMQEEEDIDTRLVYYFQILQEYFVRVCST
jgi:hypothetical protein